jgi:hypothetical protein
MNWSHQAIDTSSAQRREGKRKTSPPRSIAASCGPVRRSLQDGGPQDRQLRTHAEQELGAVDVRAFHDVILGRGAVPRRAGAAGERVDRAGEVRRSSTPDDCGGQEATSPAIALSAALVASSRHLFLGLAIQMRDGMIIRCAQVHSRPRWLDDRASCSRR